MKNCIAKIINTEKFQNICLATRFSNSEIQARLTRQLWREMEGKDYLQLWLLHGISLNFGYTHSFHFSYECQNVMTPNYIDSYTLQAEIDDVFAKHCYWFRYQGLVNKQGKRIDNDVLHFLKGKPVIEFEL